MWADVLNDPIHTLPGQDSIQNLSRPIMKNARLIEPGMRYYTSHMLKRCRYHKFIYNSYIFNIIGGFCFVSVIITLLWYCKQAKDKKDKNKDKIQEQKELILLDTIKKMNYFDQKRKSEMISNVPFESELHHEDKLFI